MRQYRFLPLVLALSLILAGCAAAAEPPVFTSPPSTGEIYLYGESHGMEAVLARELELWQDCYYKKGMRHLFVEQPYYTAEFLNLYMRAEDETILEAVYADWAGTLSHAPEVKAFYQSIKGSCPDTVFHGTDVGHQYGSTGERYLAYLEDEGLKGSEQYALALENMEQGKAFYARHAYGYRENRMVENFARAFDALGGESVMGIYGSAHTDAAATAPQNAAVPSMAGQLKARYGDALHTEAICESVQALRTDEIMVGERTYAALYFGRQRLSELFAEYQYRKFWRLEGAYADFENCPKTGDYLPYDNYPMPVEKGDVFAIDYGLQDGTVQRKYYRADGKLWEGRPATEEFLP